MGRTAPDAATLALPRAVIVEAADPAHRAGPDEASRLRAVARQVPQVFLDAGIDRLPHASQHDLVVGPEMLRAFTHPRSQGPLREMPVIIEVAPDHLRISAVWDEERYVVALTWECLATAPLLSGLELRRQTSMTPEVELGTPYMALRSATRSILVALHPAAIRLISDSVSRLIKDR